MMADLALRVVLITLLAIALVHGLPLAVSLVLLGIVAWVLIRPRERRLYKSTQQLEEISREREQLQTSQRLLQAQHEAQVLQWQQELESSRVREQRLEAEALRIQQELESLRISNQSLEAQRLQLQTDLDSLEALLEDAQGTIDQLSLERDQALAERDARPIVPAGEGSSSSDAPEDGVLRLASQERDLYPNERFELLLVILHLTMADEGAGLRGFTASPRAKHLLADLISCNPPTEASRKFDRAIKQAFRTGDSERKLKASLRELGFECERASGCGHISISVKNDNRYRLQVSSTPGDHLSRRNEATRLVSMLISKPTLISKITVA